MKKFSLCIGAFLVLFLMTSVYTAHAQADLTGYDGLWLMNSVKLRNVVYGGSPGSATIPVRGPNQAYSDYACMEVDPANPGIINLYVYDKYGTYLNTSGSLTWYSGTNVDFLGYVIFNSDDGFEYDFAYVTVSSGYKFTAVPGYGRYDNGSEYDVWDFQWGGKIPRTITYDLGQVCCGFNCTQ